nr:hypothetical protein [Tanacetum cinerariifolium]
KGKQKREQTPPNTNPQHSKKPQLPKMPKKPPVLKVKRTSKSTITTTTWFDLPMDLMVNILRRVVAVEKLWNDQKVCRDWRKICKDPFMWRAIYVDSYSFSDCRPYPWLSDLSIDDVEITAIKICENAVDRSQGQLVDITMVGFCDDELLEVVADRYGIIFLLVPKG